MYRHRNLSLVVGLLGFAFLTAGTMNPNFDFKCAIGSLMIGFVLVAFAYFRFKRPIDSFVIAFALFAFTWLQSRRRGPGAA